MKQIVTPSRGVSDPFVRQRDIYTGSLELRPSQWVERFVKIKNSDTGQIEAMDFSERKYLRRIYDTPAKRRLLFTSRQTEKCVAVSSMISLHDGSLLEAGRIKVGDRVATMRPDGTLGESSVSWVSARRRKPGVRIETRQGHVLEVASTHPIRTWEGWTEAGDLTLGTRVAAVRRCGRFTGRAAPSAERIRLTAYLIGDGGLGGNVIGFTSVPGPPLDEFKQDVETLGGTFRTYKKSEGRAVDLRLRDLPQLKTWLREDGLLGKLSGEKTIPPWVFDLSRENTALFLNRLWATDGHVSQRTRSNYQIVYASICKPLVEQVQALLWKFQIPTRIRRNWPSLYKARGEKKYAYLLTVETKEGIERFLSEVGTLGKSEGVALPREPSNNNQDTFPIAIQDLLARIIDSAGYGRRSALFEQGLSRTLKYPPTRETLAAYVDFFNADDRYDQQLVGQLEAHLFSDLYWDRIKKLEVIDDLECVDFEVEETHNFVASGVVTHNSTSLANLILAFMGLRSMYVPLFVSPSAMQTKVFSTTRIDDIIDISPLIKAMTHPSLRSNLLEKELINHSKLYLRYAFLSADRIRGLSANAVFLDELQDMLQDLIPVIEETASHHKESIYVYSGTPKTFDNPMEVTWSKFSTQSEWVIPCERHGTPKDPTSWYWNVLGEKNIGLAGPVCERCKKPITAEHDQAQWVEMNPGASIEGLRICRLMVPWFAKDPNKWKEILHAMERYPRAQWMNEVLALSYDSGSKPLTRAEIIACCDDRFEGNDEDATADLGRRFPLYAGFDWSGGGNTEGSAFTVMFVGGYVRGDARFQFVFAKRFEGPLAEPDLQMAEIMRLLKKFNIRLIGADFGGGLFPNKQLTNVFGPSRVHAFQYVARAPGKLLYKGPLHRYLVFRSLVMSDVFNAIKAVKVAFPKWENFREPFASDMLNIRAEYNEQLRLIQFIKVRGVTDDSFHAMLYCLVVSMLETRRPDIMAPIIDGNDPESLANENEARAAVELEPFAPSNDEYDIYSSGGRMY